MTRKALKVFGYCADEWQVKAILTITIYFTFVILLTFATAYGTASELVRNDGADDQD